MENKSLNQERIVDEEMFKHQMVFVERIMNLEPRTLSEKISRIFMCNPTTVLVPAYLLDENGNITEKINFDLVPEDKRELVAELGAFYFIKTNDGVKIIFFEEELMQKLGLGRNATPKFDKLCQMLHINIYDQNPIDQRYWIKDWDSFCEQALPRYMQTRKQFVRNLEIMKVPEKISVARKSITGEIEQNKKNKIRALMCFILALQVIWSSYLAQKSEEPLEFFRKEPVLTEEMFLMDAPIETFSKHLG